MGKHSWHTEIHFAVEQVVKIKLVLECEGDYTWWDEVRIPSTFFGIKTGGVNVIDAGWRRDRYSEQAYIQGYEIPLSDEEVLDLGHRIVEATVNDKRMAIEKAFVYVHLTHGDEVRKRFESDEEAEDFVSSVKKLSTKEFSVITY